MANSANNSEFWLVDARGDYVDLATWEQVGESLACGPEGWIDVGGLRHVYVEGDEAELRAAYAAWAAQAE